ncbi:hypothetical protein ACFE04_024391 [Oxalis oulophora]
MVFKLLISRFIFTNSGNAILALASNAMHFLWKWQRNDRNSTGKATASMAPQLWQPSSGILMTNDVTDSNPEEAVPCFAMSKNDSYVMSASGGKISLFNMITFKVEHQVDNVGSDGVSELLLAFPEVQSKYLAFLSAVLDKSGKLDDIVADKVEECGDILVGKVDQEEVIDKVYPRDFMQRGRVRVMLKKDDGTLFNPAVSSSESRKNMKI